MNTRDLARKLAAAAPQGFRCQVCGNRGWIPWHFWQIFQRCADVYCQRCRQHDGRMVRLRPVDTQGDSECNGK